MAKNSTLGGFGFSPPNFGEKIHTAKVFRPYFGGPARSSELDPTHQPVLFFSSWWAGHLYEKTLAAAQGLLVWRTRAAHRNSYPGERNGNPQSISGFGAKSWFSTGTSQGIRLY